jgi:hypothetical protein
MSTTQDIRPTLPMPKKQQVRERLAENLDENRRLRRLLKILPDDEAAEVVKSCEARGEE